MSSSRRSRDTQRPRREKIVDVCLDLTASVQSVGETVTTVVAITPLGDRVFAAYVGIETATDEEAQLFANRRGELVPIVTSLASADFPGRLGGGASLDFSRFVLFDTAAHSFTSPFDLRIRSFGPDLTTVLATTTIADVLVLNYAASFFPCDPNHFAMVTLKAGTGEPPLPTSTLRIYVTDTLQVAAEISVVTFGMGIVSPAAFCLGERRYVAVFQTETLHIVVGAAAAPARIVPPMNLVVYRFDPAVGLLVEVARQPLPAHSTGFQSIDVAPLRCGVARIVVGTARADLAEEVITEQQRDISLLAHDGQELRLIDFDERAIGGGSASALRLVASDNSRMDLNSVAIDATDPVLVAVGFRNQTLDATAPIPPEIQFIAGASNVMHLKRVQGPRHGDCRRDSEVRCGECPGAITRIADVDRTWATGDNLGSLKFNCATGRWLVAGSCKGVQLPPFTGFFSNLLLFRVRRRTLCCTGQGRK